MKNEPSRIFNVDETGVQIVTQGGKVLARKGSRNVQILASAERGSNTTIVACCNAIGDFIPPMVIFKGSRKPNPDSLGQLPVGSLVEVSKSGWIDKDLFLAWFEHFISHLPRRLPNEKVVLIMDGHRSHESNTLFAEALVNDVELISLPSHTSNRLQPLDVSVFGPFKRSWRERCRLFMDKNPGMIISKSVFGELFLGAWATASKRELAISGFRKSGICPLSFEALPKETFLISKELLGRSDDEPLNQSEEVNAIEETCAADILPQNIFHDEMDEQMTERRPESPTEELCTSNILTHIHDLEDESRIPKSGFTCAMVDDEQESREIGVTFASLVPALHSNRAAALEAVKRMREPKLFSNDIDDHQKEARQVKDEENCTCRPCNISFANDLSGREWLQCMECKVWEHSTCGGKCTIGTFFCKACVQKVILKLSD